MLIAVSHVCCLFGKGAPRIGLTLAIWYLVNLPEKQQTVRFQGIGGFGYSVRVSRKKAS